MRNGSSECYERYRKHHGVVRGHVHRAVFVIGSFVEESIAYDSRVIVNIAVFVK